MLQIETISKSFGSTAAVRNVSLTAAPGRVLGLVGENGAGKSTLMKIMTGIVRQDSGSIAFGGDSLLPGSIEDARRLGIRCAFQELTVIPGLTVAENLAIGRAAPLARNFDWPAQAEAAATALSRFRLDLDPSRDVAALRLGERYRLEIVKVLRDDPKVLLLDESTAALTGPEVDWLEERMRALLGDGGTIVFISHRWEEIERFCDDVAVLRNGELVHRSPRAELSRQEAVRLMSGHPEGSLFPQRKAPEERPALAVEAVSAKGLSDITLDLGRGEILGLAGLAGQGQEDFLRLLFGLNQPTSGRITFEGRPYNPGSPRAARRQAVGFVPLDRKSEGLFLGKSIAFNLTLLQRLWGRIPGFLSPRRESAFVHEQIRKIDIRPPRPGLAAGGLSGGNQQKVLFQRVLAEKPRLLLLADVTRGVDIQTKKELYRHIGDAAARGAAVLFYSTDTEELVGLCDRVAVFQRGRLVTVLSGRQRTRDRIVSASMGIARGHDNVH